MNEESSKDDLTGMPTNPDSPEAEPPADFPEPAPAVGAPLAGDFGGEESQSAEPRAVSAVSVASGESAVAQPASRRRRTPRVPSQPVDESAIDFSWYILHTLSGNEEKVRQTMVTTLAREGLSGMMQDVLIPVEDVVEVKRGKKHIKKRKLFPGYVFVRMRATEPVLKQIRRLPNLARFVGGIGGSGPVPVTDAEIGRIRVFMTETKERPKIIYEVGETVRIISGPFMDFNGTILDMDVDKGRLKIQVEIFGRATPVDLDFDQVEKV